jgi:hypothetical protein
LHLYAGLSVELYSLFTRGEASTPPGMMKNGCDRRWVAPGLAMALLLSRAGSVELQNTMGVTPALAPVKSVAAACTCSPFGVG